MWVLLAKCPVLSRPGVFVSNVISQQTVWLRYVPLLELWDGIDLKNYKVSLDHFEETVQDRSLQET